MGWCYRMIILDPEMGGCHVWCIDSNFKENFVSYIKGTPKEVLNIILPYITTYVDAENQWGNRYKTLTLTDMIYIDQCPLSREYVDICSSIGLYINIVPGKSSSKYFSNRI